MAKLVLTKDVGLLEVEFGGETVTIDPYQANDDFFALFRDYDKKKLAAEELPTQSEFYPIWAEHVTKLGGWATPSALALHKAIVAELDEQKKSEPGLSTPG